MDWIGIKRAERTMQVILTLSAIFSCLYAYQKNWWPYTTYGMVGGFFIASFLCAPNWPWFSVNPVGWHKAIDPEKEKAYWERKNEKKEKKKAKKEKKKAKKSRKSDAVDKEVHLD